MNACFQVYSMGNDLSAIGGAVATVGTSIAAGVTLGQVEALNQAVVSTAEFTANKVLGFCSRRSQTSACWQIYILILIP